ncbi:MAG: ACP phosphodiesterase [Sedimenticola sp.]|nr:ACP phosphodiesterase [Sedimenticola sp.]
MNYLAHVFLSPLDPEQQLGSLIADFTRGQLATLADHYSPGIMRGITLHRRIDRFTDENDWVLQSKRLFSDEQRRYAGIILDILYDHFLNCYWDQYSDTDRLGFIKEIYKLLALEQNRLPLRLKRLVPRIINEDWMGSYHDLEQLGQVYQRMALRLRRPNPLGSALNEVKRLYPRLSEDFHCFFPELIKFTEQQQRLLEQK